MSRPESFAPRFVVSLPIEDRRRSLRFYEEGLGLEAFGPIADDGVPEPLQFALSDDVGLMLVPTGGFGWVVGRELAPPGTSEVLLSVGVGSPAEVDDLVARAVDAGAMVVSPAEAKPWGYSAVLADPDHHALMVTAGPG
ncbi:MAG: VOC family protein [Actinobacteria bacterium]|nr:VOC family protein [Actinomycetota bacterium]